MAKFLSNAIKLFSATLAGQILGIIVMPVLSRLYSPSDFGIYQLFLSISGIIGIFSTLSYASAIQLPKKDEDAANIVILCLMLIFITTSLTTFCFFVFSDSVEQLLNAPGLSIFIPLLPFALISSAVGGVLAAWLSRRDEFGTIAKGNFISSVTGKGVSLGCGVISPSPFGLILGTIVNDATIVIVLLTKTIRELFLLQKVSFEKVKQLAYRYKKFPQYRVAADLAGTGSTAAPPLLLAVFFSPVITGYFAMALLVVRLPSKLMGSALFQVFYQKACVEKNRTGSIRTVVEMIHTRLISLGTLPCVIIMVLGPELFTLALGTQWTNAGVYAQIIAPWLFFAFILVPLGAVFNVLEQQVADFWFSILSLASRVAAVILGGIIGDPVVTMFLLSITGVFFWGWMNMYTLKIAGVSVSGAVREILRYFVLSVVFCVPLIILKLFSFPAILLIIISIVISVSYYAIIISGDSQLKQEMINFLTKIFT